MQLDVCREGICAGGARRAGGCARCRASANTCAKREAAQGGRGVGGHSGREQLRESQLLWESVRVRG